MTGTQNNCNSRPLPQLLETAAPASQQELYPHGRHGSGGRSPEVPTFTWLCICAPKKLVLKYETSETGRKRQDASNKISPSIHATIKVRFTDKGTGILKKWHQLWMETQVVVSDLPFFMVAPQRVCQVAHSFHYYTNSCDLIFY